MLEQAECCGAGTRLIRGVNYFEIMLEAGVAGDCHMICLREAIVTL